jgi:O-acetylserine/cysteine efflux transporter
MIPPLTTVALRYGIVLACCLPFLRLVPGRMALVLLTGLVAGALQFGPISYGYAVADNVPALAIAGQAGMPLGLLLAIAVDGERIAWRRAFGLVLALAGVTLLLFDPHLVDERLGVALVFAGSLAWAVSNLMLRRLIGVPVLTLYAWQGAVSFPLLLLASHVAEPGALARLADTPAIAFGWIAYTAILSSLVGHGGISWLVQKYPISVITPFTLPTAVLSVGLAHLVYGSPITPVMAIGGLMALAGVTIIALRTGRPRPAAA